MLTHTCKFHNDSAALFLLALLAFLTLLALEGYYPGLLQIWGLLFAHQLDYHILHHLFYVLSGLRRCPIPSQLLLFEELFLRLPYAVTSSIALVCQYHNHSSLLQLIVHNPQPHSFYFLKSVFVMYIVNEEYRVGVLEVARGNRPVSLLPCGVVYLEFDGPSVEGKLLDPKVVADSVLGLGLEGIAHVPLDDGGFAHAGRSHQGEVEVVVVVLIHSIHSITYLPKMPTLLLSHQFSQILIIMAIGSIYHHTLMLYATAKSCRRCLVAFTSLYSLSFSFIKCFTSQSRIFYLLTACSSSTVNFWIVSSLARMSASILLTMYFSSEHSASLDLRFSQNIWRWVYIQVNAFASSSIFLLCQASLYRRAAISVP